MHVSWMKTFIYWDIWDCSFYKGTHCQILLKKLLATFMFMFWADEPVCHSLSIAFCPSLCSLPKRFHFILANEKHQQESKGQEEREIGVYTYSLSDTWLHPTLVLFFFFFNYYYFFYFTILYWFCHTSTGIHHGCTYVPHPEPPSHLPPHTIPLGHPSAPAPSFLYPASNLDWRFIYNTILYMF